MLVELLNYTALPGGTLFISSITDTVHEGLHRPEMCLLLSGCLLILVECIDTAEGDAAKASVSISFSSQLL